MIDLDIFIHMQKLIEEIGLTWVGMQCLGGDFGSSD